MTSPFFFRLILLLVVNIRAPFGETSRSCVSESFTEKGALQIPRVGYACGEVCREQLKIIRAHITN